jgi:hypothetical protein
MKVLNILTVILCLTISACTGPGRVILSVDGDHNAVLASLVANGIARRLEALGGVEVKRVERETGIYMEFDFANRSDGLLSVTPSSGALRVNGEYQYMKYGLFVNQFTKKASGSNYDGCASYEGEYSQVDDALNKMVAKFNGCLQRYGGKE